MKLLTAAQIKQWDQFTIGYKPINSLQLMEHAAALCAQRIANIWQNDKQVWSRVDIFCGTGNNGGDGLVIARLLVKQKIPVRVFVVHASKQSTNEFSVNLGRLKTEVKLDVITIDEEHALPELTTDSLIIDALLGIGLNKPVEGLMATVINHINQSKAKVIAIDVPSGLPADVHNLSWANEGAIIHAWFTLTFQVPKTTFLLADAQNYVGQFELIFIGLMPAYLQNVHSNIYYTQQADVAQIIKPRLKFSHKSTYGHALLIAGSFGKIGAAILSAKASMRAGCGLLTAYLPKVGYTIMQTALPEVMVNTDDELYEIRTFDDTANYAAVGVGPGLGKHPQTQSAFISWVQQVKQPIVIDADGLNMIADYMYQHNGFEFPENCVITPHPKEFDRLAGVSLSAAERLAKQLHFAQKHKIVVVLKGAHTSVALPNGEVFFNSSGNAMLATAGSGDVLTGIILSFLSQGYDAKQAAIIGVYVHGACADVIKSKNKATLIASDIADVLPEVLYSFS
jgi:NAD(P)H-hydrate epimerase